MFYFLLILFFRPLWHVFFFKGYGYDFDTRQSDNENDLLHEIDNAMKFGKGFLFGKGAFHYFA